MKDCINSQKRTLFNLKANFNRNRLNVSKNKDADIPKQIRNWEPIWTDKVKEDESIDDSLKISHKIYNIKRDDCEEGIISLLNFAFKIHALMHLFGDFNSILAYISLNYWSFNYQSIARVFNHNYSNSLCTDQDCKTTRASTTRNFKIKISNLSIFGKFS